MTSTERRLSSLARRRLALASQAASLVEEAEASPAEAVASEEEELVGWRTSSACSWEAEVSRTTLLALLRSEDTAADASSLGLGLGPTGGGMGGGDPFGGSSRRGRGGMPGMGGMGGMGGHSHMHDDEPPKPKPDDITRPLPVSLEDLHNGVTKKLKITRRLLNGSEEEKIVSVVIKPGWKAGTKIRYDGMGTEVANGPAADVVCESPPLTCLRHFMS